MFKIWNFIHKGDFNSEMKEGPVQVFCDTYNLKCLVKEPTCYKNMDNPSCIALILTNKSLFFRQTSIIETVLSDVYKLTTTTMKSTFYKQEPKIIHHWNYNHFGNDIFQSQLYREMINRGINCINCSEFESLFISTLDKHAPNKIMYTKANNSPSWTNRFVKQSW